MTPPGSLKFSDVNKFNSLFANDMIDFVFFRRKRIHGISPTDLLNYVHKTNSNNMSTTETNFCGQDLQQYCVNENSGNGIIDCKVTKGLTDLRLKYDYQSLTDILAQKVLKQVFDVNLVTRDGTKTNKKNLKVNKLGLVSRKRQDKNCNEFYLKTNNILFKPQKYIKRSNSNSKKYNGKEVPLRKNTFSSVILRKKGSPQRKFKYNQSESMEFAVKQTNCPMVTALRNKFNPSANENGQKPKKYSDTKVNKTKKETSKNNRKNKIIGTKYSKRKKSLQEFNGIRILKELSERIGNLENLIKEYKEEVKKTQSARYKKRKRKDVNTNKEVYPFELTLTDLYSMYTLKSQIYLPHALTIPMKEIPIAEKNPTRKLNTGDFVELPRLKDKNGDFKNSDTVGIVSPFKNLKVLYRRIQFSSKTPITVECDLLSNIQEKNNQGDIEKCFDQSCSIDENNTVTDLKKAIAFPSYDSVYLGELQKKKAKKKNRARKLKACDSNNEHKV